MTQNLDRFKFRVWDKEFQTMLIRKKHFLNSFGKQNFIWTYQLPNNEGGQNSLEHCIETSEGFVVMQSMGLKDKNGQLIYEGDLAKVYDETIEAERLLSVVWDNEKCGFDIYQYESNDPIFCYMEEFMGSYEVDHELQSLEIIGNIYENPELLENYIKI